MSLIEINDLTFAYPGNYDNVFEHVNLRLDSSWKLGLTGRNGRGKTTLLRLLKGDETEFSGSIRGVPQCVYFPTGVAAPHKSVGAVLHAMCPDAQDWELQRELSLIGLPDDTIGRSFATLSGGERTKVLLTALFLDDNAFPLIDEPTTHLDAEGRAAAAKYLRRKNGFILVSHDRAFLDGSIEHILAINRSDIQLMHSDFTTWFSGFQLQQAAELQENASLKKQIIQLENSAARASKWAHNSEKKKKQLKDGQTDRGFASHKAAKMKRRAKSIAARSAQVAEQKNELLHNLENADELQLHPLQHHQDTLLRLVDIVPQYGERAVSQPVSLELRSGQRLFVTGANGSGKSSLLRVILGTHSSYSGTIQKASRLIISSIPQDTSSLTGTVEDYAAAAGADISLMLTIARKLGLERDDFARDLSMMSEGQKKKIAVARSLCEKAHIYVWDEPLNYLDVFARMQLEQLICDAGAAMILVEHDRAFRDAVGTDELHLQASPPNVSG